MNSLKYSLFIQETLLQIGCFEKALSKTLKKPNFTFVSEADFLHGPFYEQQKSLEPVFSEAVEYI